VPVDSISVAPLNPRNHSRKQVAAIARSIEAFGFNAPILVDRSGRIVAGHGRLEAAKLLGMLLVPVVRLEHLNEQQAKAYMLADNKLTDRSTWDDDRLAICLKELHNLSLNFEIECTGFEAPEIDLRIQRHESQEPTDDDDEFDPPEHPPVSRLGDNWLLGRHRIVCGNALDPASYDTLLGSEFADAVFTDPPYNVKINGHAVGGGRKTYREFPMASGEMTRGQFTLFLLTALNQMQPHVAENAVSFMCMDWRHVAETIEAITTSGNETINLCVWVKPHGGMGSLYRSRHELVFVFRGRGEKHRNNVQLGAFGRNRTNVWNYSGANNWTPKGQQRTVERHPTVKPVALVADAILDVSKRDEIVLDPFCGSGTTIVAAERTGRRGYGIELDPLYVDLTISRWQRITKQEAKLADGRSFEDVRAERAHVGS
jgi:DNA modification methylase